MSDTTWLADPFPPPPLAPPPAARRRLPIAAILVSVCVAGAIVVLAVVALSGGDGLPSSIDGMERLATPEAKEFERVLAETSFMGVSMRGAMYSTAESDSADLVVEVFDGVPPGSPLSEMSEAFTTALTSFDATIDESSRRDETRAGTDYSCVRIESSQTGPNGATVCTWSGNTYGAVVDLRTGDTTSALDLAEEIHAAVDA